MLLEQPSSTVLQLVLLCTLASHIRTGCAHTANHVCAGATTLTRGCDSTHALVLQSKMSSPILGIQ